MGFGDMKTTEGVKVLNEYMADKSYIESFVPSQADVVVFQALDGPPAACFSHALRWYKHIKSYEKSASSLPGVRKPLEQYGPAGSVVVPAATDAKGRKSDDDDDDDLDLFGSDEESEESKRIREERLSQYATKKSTKPTVIAKSSVVLDVKPWDDETDMAEVEKHVRSVAMDGLIWGGSKLVPVGYGIKKLQMQCVIEDDKVSVDLLEELITAFEDHVQSVDVAAFNKI
uniref:elongation factor 1-beta n=1 Tax=Myxine glutinosa TaxID=7769 RepID=UPI0035902926